VKSAEGVPAASVTAEVTPSEGPAVEPEDFEQKYKTLLGRHEATQAEFKKLKEQQANLADLGTKVESVLSLVQSQGEQIGLITDSLPEIVGQSEELSERIQKAQETRQLKVKFDQQAYTTRAEILEMLQVAKIDPSGEEAKPALKVYLTGDFPKAITTARQIVASKIEKLVATPISQEATLPEPEKPKQKVITKSPVGQEGWRDLPSQAKLQKAFAEKEK